MSISFTDISGDISADATEPAPLRSARRLPRRIPTPASEPPYDDDPAARSHHTQGALALDVSRRWISPPAHLRLVVDKPVSRRTVDDETLFGRQPTPTSALPDARVWARQLGRAVAEVLAGDRPVSQLMRWTDEAVFGDLNRRAAVLAQAGTGNRGARNRVSVASVHVCEPRDGIAEVSVHLRQGQRSRAYAVRLEGLDGRWRCTALQMA